MFGTIIRSIKKSYSIKKLTKEYIKYSPVFGTSAFEALTSDRSEKQDKVLGEIVEIAFKEPLNQPTIKKFKITKDKLKDCVKHLELIGCGQFFRGHYVAISSIMFASTLEYIFYKERNNREEKERMAIELIKYFDQNKTGNIVKIDY
jgi:hypothetical protein